LRHVVRTIRWPQPLHQALPSAPHLITASQLSQLEMSVLKPHE
jgi:hypothetical protein